MNPLQQLMSGGAQAETPRPNSLLALLMSQQSPGMSVSNGMVQSGNVNLGQRPRVPNGDGVSTVRSMGVNFGGPEVLLPTVSDDGRLLSEAEAIDLYRMSGRHLGMFDSPTNSDAYAQRLHEDQARIYSQPNFRR